MTQAASPAGAVLVTGAAKRIGRAISLGLARQGHAVALHYNRSEDEAAKLAAEIEAAGGQACLLQGDLSQEKEVTPLIGRAAAALGQPIAALVNNASLFEKDSALDATRASWDAHMEANLRAPFVLMQEFAKSLPETERGCIVNILDQRVFNLSPHFLSYTLSKSALWTLTRTMALALAPRIRVNGIGPGPTLKNERQSEEDFAAQWQAIPLARSTAPEEIAQAVLFLLNAPGITGQMIAVDGGEHLGWAQESTGISPRE